MSPPEDRFDRRVLAAFGKARERGLSWLLQRTVREIQVPPSLPGRLLHSPLVAMERGALRGIRAMAGFLPGGRPSSSGTLYFFLDLDVSPITFDFTTHLATAEIY